MSNAININSNKVCDKVIQPVIFRGHDDVQPFDPYDLFISGRTGVYFDPSDFSTLFQDSAGTTPVTGTNQPVGLVLDVHKSLALGSEVIPTEADRDFTSDTGYWSKEGTSTIGGGQVVFSAGPSQAPIYRFNALPQGYFEATLTCTISSGSIFLRLGNADINIMTSSGTYTVRAYNTLLSTLAVVSDSAGCVGTLDHFSVRYVQGNHAIQPTATKRPILEESGGSYSLKFDGIDDELITTFPAPLGSNCTIGIAVKPAATILTGQTVDATYVMNTDNYGVVIVDDALTPEETANLTEWLNAKAGNV